MEKEAIGIKTQMKSMLENSNLANIMVWELNTTLICGNTKVSF